jgi:hypothetical protein
MPFIDEFTNKLAFDETIREWIALNWNDVQHYLDKKVSPSDHYLIWKKFIDNPYLCKVITENFRMSNKDKLDYLYKTLFSKSTLAVICGMRRWGKTALLCWLGEIAHQLGLNVYFVQTNIPLPSYFKQIENPLSAEDGSLVLYDEASITLNARRAMGQLAVDTTSLMAISGHRDISIIFATQHSAIIDINTLRLADVLMFKKLSWEETVKKEQKTTLDIFTEFIHMMMPTQKNETLFTDGEKWFVFNNPLPSFWTQEISKSYKSMSLEEGIQFAKTLFWDKGIKDLRIIDRQLRLRGVNITESQLIQFLGLSKYVKKTKRKETD